jgi:hypothetical protein
MKDQEPAGGQSVSIDIECNPSAFKHGVTEEDIRFAFE